LRAAEGKRASELSRHGKTKHELQRTVKWG
jgi:hypothetical protein